MTCMKFTVFEETTGWFVRGGHSLGPFFSKQRAVDLAEGMVSALRAVGEDAEIFIAAHPDPAPLSSALGTLAEKLRVFAPTAPIIGAGSLRPAAGADAEYFGATPTI
jgi:hypothetical protein